VEVNKMLVVSKFEILSLSCADMDGTIILDDVIVGMIGEGGKELRDVLAVVLELRRAVREDVSSCLDCLIPSDNPLSMGIHLLGRFGSSDNKLDSPNVFHMPFILHHGIECGKDVVQVNRMSHDEIRPF
jgi:hypothetical protein